MQLLVEMEYDILPDILQINLLIWLYFVNITPDILSHHIKWSRLVHV